jgi:hypothetical protein
VDYTELLQLVRSSNESLEKIGTSLSALGDPDKVAAATALAPSATPASVVTQGVPDQGAGTPYVQRQILDMSTRMALRSELRKKSLPELHMLFQMQMAKRNSGIPFEMWAASGGHAGAIFDAFHMQAGMGGAADISPTVLNALDTGGSAALIRQDLEPILYEIYIRTFPAFERFVREPANGLTHTFNQITSFGAAKFMAELGTVTDDQSTYVRKTTNIAIAATRRGLSLKSQYAVAAGGMGYNPMDLELQGGLRAISNLMQFQIFSGQSSNSGGSASTEDGTYDANGFDGLRKLLNSARAKEVNPLTGTAEDIRNAVDLAVAEIVQAGGSLPSIIWTHPNDKITFDTQQDKNVRYMAPENLVNVGVGIVTNAINTVVGPLPLAIVPGTAIGNYTATNGHDVRDMYILDESTISLPYLGSEGPTVLDIPIGISGQLTHLFIIFGMWGLAEKALPFSNKLRVRQS